MRHALDVRLPLPPEKRPHWVAFGSAVYARALNAHVVQDPDGRTWRAEVGSPAAEVIVTDCPTQQDAETAALIAAMISPEKL